MSAWTTGYNHTCTYQTMRTVILIDNYDSFTFNLYQQALSVQWRETVDVRVFRNDEITVSDLFRQQPAAIIISPGPGRPQNAGISLAVIEKALLDRIPLLGVCLGHQALAEIYGGRIIKAPTPLHGYCSRISHTGVDLFDAIPSPCSVMRYHSLVVAADSLPDSMTISATCPDDGTIMAIAAADAPAWGVQFHPESFLSQAGTHLMNNFFHLSFHAHHTPANATQ